MKKRLLSMLIVFCMLAAMYPTQVFALEPDNRGYGPTASGECGAEGDLLTWTLDADGVLTISGDGAMADYEEEWEEDPDTGEYYLAVVTTPWAEHRTEVTGIVVESGVTTLGEAAFTGCENAAYADLPSSLTSIGELAFDSCFSLASITLPEGLEEIGEYAFIDCRGLTMLEIPESVTSVANGAFMYCTNLVSVVFRSGTTQIGDSLFSGCETLQAVTLPSGLTEIPSYTFEDCAALTDVMLPEHMTSIGNNAFINCISLTSMTFPESVTQIGNQSFMNCEALETITLPLGLTKILINAFLGCAALSDVFYYGDQQTWDAMDIRNGNDRLLQADLHLISAVSWSLDDAGVLTISGFGNMADYSDEDIPASMAPWWEAAHESAVRVVVEDGVKSIGSYAFAGMTALQNVSLPRTLNSIGAYAFAGCTALKSIAIPSSVTSIEEYAFTECTALTSADLYCHIERIPAGTFYGCEQLPFIAIPSGVAEIEQEAFNGCPALESIVFPLTLESVFYHAFEECGLRNIYYEGSEEQWSAVIIGQNNFGLTLGEKNWYYNYASRSGDCGAEGTNLIWELDASSGALTISGTGAMADFELAEQQAPQTGETSPICTAPWFEYRAAVRSVVVEEGVTGIGAGAFTDCENLSSVELPSTLTAIGDGTFDCCTGLTTVLIPDSVTAFGGAVFLSCEALQTVTLPSGLTEIPESTFNGCISLSEVVIPSGVTSIGVLAFYGCESLTEVTIPDHVTAIGFNAFCGSGIESLTIPTSVETIGMDAFSRCPNLESVTFCCDLPYEARAEMILAECPSLSTVTFGEGATSIGEFTFDQYEYPLHVTIGPSVTSIGDFAFQGCNITELTFSANVTDIGEGVFKNCRVQHIEITEGVTFIWPDLFRNMPELRTVSLPSTLKTIGGEAFADCEHIESITIPAGVEEWWYAFSGCTALTDVTLQEGLEIIDEGAFDACFALAELSLPQSLKSIGNAAFSDCVSLTELTIPEGTTDIGERAFSFCSSLSSLSVPSSVTSIGKGAFINTALTEPVFLPWMTEIGEAMYQGCAGLTSVEIPAGITVIGDSAFLACTNLAEITIPASVTTIGSSAFGSCSALETVYFGGSAAQWAEIEKGSGNTALDNAAIHFAQAVEGTCGQNLTWVLDGGGVLTISGTSPMEDYSKSSEIPWNSYRTLIRRLVVEPGVTVIGQKAFSGCGNLAEVELPSTLKKIGASAFEYCASLSTVKFSGSETQWAAIEIETTGNGLLNSAEIQYRWPFPSAPRNGVCGSGLTWELNSEGRLTISGTGTMADFSADGAPWKESRQWITEVIVSPGVSSLSAGALEDFTTLETLYLPDTVTVIEIGALTGGSLCATVYAAADSAAADYAAASGMDLVLCRITSASADTTIGGDSAVFAVTLNVPAPVPVTVFARDAQGTETEIPCAFPTEDLLSLSEYSLTGDLTGIESGEYTLVFRTEGYDSCEISCTVDRTAPTPPQNFAVTPGILKCVLTWDRVTQTDVARIRICRAEGDGEAALLTVLTGRTEVSYTDTNVVNGRAYTYYLSFEDSFGQESEAAGPVTVTPREDLDPPILTSITPQNGAVLTGEATFIVKGSDNMGLRSIAMEYSAESGEGPWTALETVETVERAVFQVNTLAMDTDTLYVRFLLTDVYGNAAYSAAVYHYGIDNEAPPAVGSITAGAESTVITLFWPGYQATADFDHFAVERQNTDGSYSVVLSHVITLGANIAGLTPGTEYVFRVAAYDRYGNRSYSEQVTAATANDTTAPVISRILPAPARFNGVVNMRFTVSDDYGVSALFVQTSADGVSWEDYTTMQASVAQTSTTLLCDLNTTVFPEGLLYVRGVAIDVAGNRSDESASAPYVQYMVDRTAPAVPVGLTGDGSSGVAYLSWTQGGESDLNGYRIYRSAAENENGSLIISGLKTISYTDAAAAEGQIWYYRISCMDTAGNESDLTDPVAVAVAVIPDTSAPRIISVSPSDGFVLAPGTQFKIKASDDRLVSEILYSMSVNGENWSEWQSVVTSADTVVITLPFTAESLAASSLSLKIKCRDAAGNESEAASVSYTVDAEPPAAPVLSAEASAMSITLHWTAGAESDLAGFYIYRKTADAAEYSLIAQRSIGSGGEYLYKDTSVSVGMAYSYFVSAVDMRGNTSNCLPAEAVEPINLDEIAPELAATGDATGSVNAEMHFSAAGSTDNVGITAYHWDFGDGHNSSECDPIHIYEEAGSYTVTVSVSDAAGNTASGTFDVTVLEEDRSAVADITVIDENGTPVAGAGVYFDLGGESQCVFYTNSSGIALVTGNSGTFQIGVYKEGYLPARTELEMIYGAPASKTVSIVQREIVTGSLTVEPMTFEEIRQAGIDVDDPANQEVFQFEITLIYNNEVVVMHAITNNETVLKDPEPVTITDQGGQTRILTPYVFHYTGNTLGSGGSITGDERRVPIITVLDLPGEAVWLKDFFDVHLYVLNQADPDFVLDYCRATLNVPDGMSLVESNRTGVSPVVTMGVNGSISGGEEAAAEWILRGDVGGDYSLSADFDALLRDFNEEIHAVFETEEPIHVRQGDGLSMDLVVQNQVPDNEDYHILIGLRNDDPAPYYLPAFSGFEQAELDEHYKTLGEQIVSTSMESLEPGEEMWYCYTIPRSNFERVTDGERYLVDSITEALSDTSIPVRTTILYITALVNPSQHDFMPRFLVNGIPYYFVDMYNDVDSMRLMLNPTDGMEWTLYRDAACSSAAAADITLEVGDNVFYVKVTGENEGGLYRLCLNRSENVKPQNETALFPVTYYSKLGERAYNIVVPWGWDQFAEHATEYDNDLSVTALALSRAAEHSQNSVGQLLRDLGFESVSSCNYDKDGDVFKPAATFAIKNVLLDGKRTNVISVVVRGTADFGDAVTDLASLADGFLAAEQWVKLELGIYYAMTENVYEAEQTVFFITGHSLGAAVASRVGSSLRNYSTDDRVFCYTFAAPRTEVLQIFNTHWNVFNILNDEDIVTMVPPNHGARSGVNFAFSRNSAPYRLRDNFTQLTGRDLDELMSIQPEGEDLFALLADLTGEAWTRIGCAHSTDVYLAYLLSRLDMVPATEQLERHLDLEFYSGSGDASICDEYENEVVRIRDGAVKDCAMSHNYCKDGKGIHICLHGSGTYTLHLYDSAARVRGSIMDPETGTPEIREYTRLDSASDEIKVVIGETLNTICALDKDGEFLDETPAGGEALIWSLDKNGLLTISGSGALADMPENGAPWHEFSGYVLGLLLDNEPPRIGVRSLGNLSNLAAVFFPESTFVIGTRALAGSGVERIDVPASVQWLEPDAFADLENLTDVYYYSDQENWLAINGDEAGLGENVRIHYYNSMTANVGTHIEDVVLMYNSTMHGYKTYAGLCFDFEWLNEPTATYNQELAIASLGLAMSAMEADDNRYSGSRGSEPARFLLGQLGFATTPQDGFFEKGLLRSDDPETGTIGMVVSKREIDGVTYVAVGLRGGGYGNGGWAGDFDVGYIGPHAGFEKAATFAEENLRSYFSRYGIDTSEVRIWLTGFSRSAAIANLLSGMLRRDGLCEDGNIYTYTFATPNNNKADSGRYGDIFNIINPVDRVPMVPFADWQMEKQGTSLDLPQYYTVKNDELLDSFFEKFFELSDHDQYGVRKNQEKLLKEHLTKVLTDSFSRTDFVRLLQDPLMDFLWTGDFSGFASLLDGAVTFADLQRSYNLINSGEPIKGIHELIGKVAAAIESRLMRHGPNDPVVKLLYKILEVGYSAIVECKTLMDAGILPSSVGSLIDLLKLDKDLPNLQLIMLLINLKEGVTDSHLFMQHWPETYIAWLLVTDDNEMARGKRFRTAVVRCPVDIEVYSEQGQLVGRTVTELYEIEDENGELLQFYATTVDESVTTIAMTVVGNGKSMVLPDDQEYQVVVRTSDAFEENDTMTYTVSDYLGGTEVATVVYENVPLTSQAEYNGVITAGSEPISDCTLTENGTTIVPTSIVQKQTVRTLLFDANGGEGEMLPMSFLAGESIILPNPDFIAPESMRFRAWLIDGEEYAACEMCELSENTVAQAVWESKDETVSMDVTVDDGGTLNYVVKNLGELTADLYVAVYDADGRMLKLQIISLDEPEGSVALEEYHRCSLFVLERGSYAPLCPSWSSDAE